MSIGAGIDLLKTTSPVVSFTSMDAESMEADLVTYARTISSDWWTNFNPSEPAYTQLKLQAYFGDLLSYYYNAAAQETQPMTALRKKNFRNTARAWDFELTGPVGSSVDCEVVSDPALLPYVLYATGNAAFKAQASNGVVLMPASTTLIVSQTQTVPFVAGDLQNNELLGTSDGTKDQVFQLSEKTLIDSSLSVSVGGSTWSKSTKRASAQSTDRVYFVEVDDDTGYANIVFGDGVNGAVPALGAEIRATYKVGGGKASNISRLSVTSVITPLPGLISVNNPTDASGGDDAMTLRQAKIALPASVNTNDRAVTWRDYATVLLASGAPGGIAKAASAPGVGRDVNVWPVPVGGGVASITLKNSIAAYLEDKKGNNSVIHLLDHTNMPLEAIIGVYVRKNFLAADVITKVRALLVTEDTSPSIQQGIFDFDNVGLGARDDEGEPQITAMRIHKLMRSLEDSGLQKIVIEVLRTVPQTKQPLLRRNAGNGTISDVAYPGNFTVRREFRVLFTSPLNFTVYRRVVGITSLITDVSIVDDSLDLGAQPDFSLPLPASTIFSPNRYQEFTFNIDPALTTGNLITKATTSSGSVFGAARAPGYEYYLELVDGTGSLPAADGTVSYTSPVGDVSFNVNGGTAAFTTGDYLLFDVFPAIGDIVLRPDELPVFLRDENGVATNLSTLVRTAQ